MGQFDKLKQQVYEANMELPRRGLVLYSFGNVSAVDRPNGVMAIKPSGVNYETMRADDMVVLNLEGNIVEGKLRPSSDTKTHLVLYNHFPRIGAIAHTHSTYAVAWAQAAMAIPVLGTTHADHLQRSVPCTEFMSEEMIEGDYEEQTGYQILDCFRDLSASETEMVLVAGHGPFTWGPTAQKAVYNSVILEELAQMALLTLQINPEVHPLNEALINKHYQRKHGPQAYYGQ